MARVVIASMLARWLSPPPTDGAVTLQADGASVGDVLESLFRQQPGLRGYVLDEHGAIRRHVAVFVDGTALQPKSDLARSVGADAEIQVIQALSGG